LAESTDDTVISNRFLKPNEKNVTIVDLQLTDVFVIQCNCTNNHGYVFSDVYLNVLSKYSLLFCDQMYQNYKGNNGFNGGIDLRSTILATHLNLKMTSSFTPQYTVKWIIAVITL